jgi:hypothetical protein
MLIECEKCGTTVVRTPLGGSKFNYQYEGNFHLRCDYYREKLKTEKELKLDAPACPYMDAP